MDVDTTTPLPALVRRFLKRTRLSQSALAQEADVSLATISIINRADDDHRFKAETETAVRQAIARIVEAEEVGGWELSLEVDQVQRELEAIRLRVAELAARLTDPAG